MPTAKMKKPVQTEYGSGAAEGSDSEQVDSDVKVPESFQKAASLLLGQCSSPQCLDYLMSCCSDKRQEMSSADTAKDFDDEGMD